MADKQTNPKGSLQTAEKNFWCNWKEYITLDENAISKELLQLKKQHRSFRFIEEYLNEKLKISPKISRIILEYLPIRTDRKNEFIAHFDTVPLTKKAVKAIQIRARENITRFLNVTGTKGMLSPQKIENPIQMLDYYIYEIYWFRMGIQQFSNGYPCQPADILGILRNNKWFYYKDGHPQLYNATTHRQWILLTANNLGELLFKMDYRDINKFVYNYSQWSPMDLKRCGCNQCKTYYNNDGKPKQPKQQLLVLPSYNNNNKIHGNELQQSLISGKKKKSKKCCVIL